MGTVLAAVGLFACGGGLIPYRDPDAGPPDAAAPDGGQDVLDASLPVRLAVVGDYGEEGDPAADVAALVRDFDPDLVATTGDNNYPVGEAETIDGNIGRYYARFIHPYRGDFGPGADRNRFFPVPGNADWDSSEDLDPYLDYFALPGNERYYDVRWGPLHLFCLDADDREPDGRLASSVQGEWAREALAATDAPWRFVFTHHAPVSSGDTRGSTTEMQWPFRAWGASAVLSGHDHSYERLRHDGLFHLVNGLGGRHTIYGLGDRVAGSELFFNAEFGALFVEIDETRARFRFVTRAGAVVDELVLPGDGVPDLDESLISQGDGWRFLSDGTDPGAGWRDVEYDDSAWPSGPSPLGAGEDDEETDVGNPERVHRFRRLFEVADRSGIAALRLALQRDDGAVVWLNGVEVVRSNLPDGPMGPDTRAALRVDGLAEDAFVEASVDPALLGVGTNVVAAELHPADEDDRDASFSLLLVARRAAVVVPAGSTWRFDLDEDPGWREVGFDDSAWREGAAPIGWGDEGLATTIAATDAVVRIRRAFVIAGDPAGYWLRLRRDDGAVVWIDGVQVLRSNVPPSPVPDSYEDAFVETFVEPLGAGLHVLAVELHGALDDDRRFDLELLAVPR